MSNALFTALHTALQAGVAAQASTTAEWHMQEPTDVPYTAQATLHNLQSLILAQHQCNFKLWHVEDTARRTDVSDSVIAECKRSIDGHNQRRNDLIEKIDSCLVALMQPTLPQSAAPKQNTETLGMAIDRLSILALKIFHMHEQTQRTDVGQDHKVTCAMKLETLAKQRCNLEQATLELLAAYAQGEKTPKLYHQFKMYNDPTLNPELYGKG